MESPRFTFNPKEGIDNPAMIISDDNELDVSLLPRLCHLKRLEGQSFGFMLTQQSGGNFEISTVELWSPAEAGGLREGDRVLEVNEEDVGHWDFSRVVKKIQSSGFHLFLLVLGRAELQQALSIGLDLQMLAKASKGDGCSRPRLCHIRRDPELGLGMSVASVEAGPKGRYAVSTVPHGPAERAGVHHGDRLIWINGLLVSAITNSALHRTVKRSGDALTVLVVDANSEACYARRKVPILPVMAQGCGLPHSATSMHLVRGDNGYGFLLRQERLAGSRRIVHVLREVDAGSPAAGAGMEDGDLLLAVNGEAVESAEHEDIVQRIRQSGDEVVLTSISVPGRDFFRKLDISPLLFHELTPLTTSAQGGEHFHL
ncbi:Na(+)/H(+) exchange regulatory cofactor NHE-RF4-like isoform X2 [Betta splendens]|uniref:Na(+)/H(+) exchange regulatory cofactor NHE-RF4-like isoform X2 n=2 Tax=Betta splendens TaxID=158456 RepID=A0A6P7P7I0_BETSP|nr:Na(+)/H(+) exchange regulatory cofactor NHE-RF4-like isoform X2 [Betta splendens]